MRRWPRWLPVCALLLAACSARQVQQPPSGPQELAYQARSAGLVTLEDWEFTGRLAVDDGTDGGSGRLLWQTEGPASELDFRGALGRGAWNLAMAPGEAVLKKSDGSTARAPDVDRLVLLETGWHLPVGALQWWVRGLRAPGPFDDLFMDDGGRVQRFRQEGWTIEYRRYRDVSGIAMPHRMEAVSGSYRVKLAVSRWRLGDGDAGDG